MSTFVCVALTKVLLGDVMPSIEVSVWNVNEEKEEFVLVLSVSESDIVEQSVRDLLKHQGYEAYELIML